MRGLVLFSSLTFINSVSGFKRMKIGIVTDAIDDGNAGISVYTHMLVKHLLELGSGHEIVLIHHRKNNHPIYSATAHLIVPMKKMPFAREYRKVIQLPKVLEKEGFDLVHDTTQIGPFFKNSAFKKIVTIHDLVPLRFPSTTASFAQRIHHKMGLPRILKRVDAIIAVSKSTKSDIEEFYPVATGKIKVIYEAMHARQAGGVDVDILKKYNVAKPYFLYLGTLEPRKNIERIVQAFAGIKQGMLVIAGKKGWKFDDIFAKVKELGLQDRVVFTGFVPDSDVPALYSSAQAFVWPSLYEGFGLPILEAMYNRCPVITSNNSSLPEVAGDAAILVDPQSVSQITKAMRDVCDTKLATELRNKGTRQVARFSWESAASETLRLYEQVMKGKGVVTDEV